MYSHCPTKKKFLDKMVHLHFLLDEMGLDEMGLPTSLLEVLELLLGVGLDRAQTSGLLGISCKARGQRTVRTRGPLSSHMQGPRAFKAL